MELNLKKIKRISEKNNDENWEFRSFLICSSISSKIVDKMVHRFYKEIMSEIDCTKCGNCCKEMSPCVELEEIENLSNSLGISIEDFEKKYLFKMQFEDGYMFSDDPCPFLRNNMCSCYEHRPPACVFYPPLHTKHFTSKITMVIESCAICPIVFNVYERLKDKVWHREKERYKKK
jgi:Fe-S-cluster containining protein